jgi:hypothetical protein
MGARKPLHSQPVDSAKATGKPEPEGEQAHGEDVSHMDIHQVVAQHGPADKIEMEHDHEGGMHSKMSHHGGKMHHSEHGSAEEAHDAARAAAGIDGDAKGESPEAEMQEEAALPGMKQHKGY